jgi:hypothetical protein
MQTDQDKPFASTDASARWRCPNLTLSLMGEEYVAPQYNVSHNGVPCVSERRNYFRCKSIFTSSINLSFNRVIGVMTDFFSLHAGAPTPTSTCQESIEIVDTSCQVKSIFCLDDGQQYFITNVSSRTRQTSFLPRCTPVPTKDACIGSY